MSQLVHPACIVPSVPLAAYPRVAMPRLGLSLSLALHGLLGLATLSYQSVRPADMTPPPLHLVLHTQQALPLTSPSSVLATTPSPPLKQGHTETSPINRPTDNLPQQANLSYLNQQQTKSSIQTAATTSMPTQASSTNEPVSQTAPTPPAHLPSNLPSSSHKVDNPNVAPAAPPSEPTLGNLGKRYALVLSERLSQQTDYPRTAAMRGWQGLVQIRITLSRQGDLLEAQIANSSGFSVLDQHALQRVKEATPLPTIAGAGLGDPLQLLIPVHYRLERS